MDRLQEMQTFCAVVDAGSFVAAAEALGISKAAASRYVGELESRLGVRLLHRTTRRLSLTPEGEVFVVRARELLSGVAEAEAEVTQSRDIARGILRINAPVSFGISHLARLWGEFRRRYPEVELRVDLADRLVDIVEEGFDLAIRVGRLQSSSLISRRLTSTRLRVCAAPDYLAAQGTPAVPADLAKHQIIGYSHFSTGDEWHFNGPDGEVSVRVRPWMVANNGETCVAAAVAGQGLVLQPGFLVNGAIAQGELMPVLDEYPLRELGVYALYPTRRFVSPKVRAMVDFLQNSLPDTL